MFKPLIVVLAAVISSLVFVGFIRAEGQDGGRVIYEENTSFEDAKHRAKVLSQMRAADAQAENNSELDNPQKQEATEAWMEKILPLIEKFLGKDAAGLLDAYRKGPNETQKSEFGQKKSSGEFREFSDKHEWKGIRRSGSTNSAQ